MTIQEQSAASSRIEPPSGTLAIAATGLFKTYGKGKRGKQVQALDGLSISVEAGTVFGLLGPNGAGKSTTVKILTTLSLADRGTATVAGLDVVRKAARIRERIGVVAQNSGVIGPLTGRENLTLQGQVYGMSGRALKARVQELLDRFGIAEAADRLASGFSGGMRRKLDVAMGLINRPEVLFLDEPTTGLDPEARAEMWREIDRLRGEEKLTILLTTHYLEEADRLGHQLAIVDHGKVVAQGTPDQLKGELRGDAIHVELADPSVNGNAKATLERVTGVRDVLRDGTALHCRVDSGPSAVPSVLTALEAQGVVVAAATVARPSLDDVYLRYAGRRYQTEENV